MVPFSAGLQFSAVKKSLVTFRGSVVWYPSVRAPVWYGEIRLSRPALVRGVVSFSAGTQFSAVKNSLVTSRGSVWYGIH